MSNFPKAGVLLDTKPKVSRLRLLQFAPNQFYRYVLKQGMNGWDVWAVQVALNSVGASPQLVEDGAFGPKTAAAVQQAQTSLGITADAICGPQTQSSLCVRASTKAEKSLTPAGLVKGICLGESGGIIPATSAAYSNGSRDYGPFQDNKAAPTQIQVHDTFNLVYESHALALSLNSNYRAFRGQPGAQTDEAAWEMSVLNYNWPAAAQQIAAGNGSKWVYIADGKPYKLSDPAPWIMNIGVQGVTTGQQWCDFYVESKITYVKNWSIA